MDHPAEFGPQEPIRSLESGGISRPTIVLIVLLLCGFAVSVILAHRNLYPSYDGTFYLNMARDLVALGEFRPGGFPPGYPLLIAPVLLNLGWAQPQAPLIAGQVVNVLAGTLLGLLSYRLAREEFSRIPSLLLCAVVLFLPLALQLSASDLSGTSFACFLVGGWLLFASDRLTLAGLVWGYGYLIRPEGLVVIVAVGLAGLLRRRWGVWRLLAAAGVPVLPYIVLLSMDAHGLRVTGKWSFLQYAIQSHPGPSLLGHYLGNSTELLILLGRTLGPALVLLAIVGALARPRRALICLSPLVLLPVFDFRMAERYLLPYLPFLLVSAVGGALWIVDRLSASSRRRIAIGLITGVMIASLLGAGYARRELLRGNFEYYPAMRDAGIWMRERVDRETIIAGRKPYVSFWAWCQFRRIPEQGTLDEVIAWAESEGCEFLVIHVGVALGMAPVLVPLLEGIPPPLTDRIQLAKIFSIAGQPNETTYIYRILAAPFPREPQEPD